MNLLEYAEQQATAGMAVALDHAESVTAGWADRAYSFLVRFAKDRDTFISEDVSDASKHDPDFPQPPTDRAWGHIYRRAVKNGIIVRHNSVGKSRRRHASICPVWQSRISGVLNGPE